MPDLKVTFFGLDNQANDRRMGTISLVGGKLVADFPGVNVNPEEVLRARILVGDTLVTSESPETWVRSLYRYYKSPYFRTTRAEEV